MTDQRPQIRCSRCGAAAAVAPDRDEPAGGSECWRCAFSGRDLATMKAEAFDMQRQSRCDDLDLDLKCIRNDSTKCGCPLCIESKAVCPSCGATDESSCTCWQQDVPRPTVQM